MASKIFVHAALIMTAISLVSCSSPQKSAEPTAKTPKTIKAVPTDTAAAPAPANGFMPACLNVIENDRRVEFNGSHLIVTETGKPKRIALDNGERVKCEQLKILEGASKPSVVIAYMTREEGTSTLVADRMMAVASIAEGKWVVRPFLVERLFRDSQGDDSEVRNKIEWTEEQGQPVLTRTNIETGKVETFRF